MNLPPIIKDPPLAVEEKKEEPKPILNALKDKTVLCYTRDLKKEDLLVLQSYGKVILFEACYNNIELDQLDFLFLLVDLRLPADRLYFQKHIAQQAISKVLYRHAFEDDLVFNEDVLQRTKLPAKQATLEMYLQLLSQKQLAKPRACWSFFKKVLTSSKV